MQSEPKRVTEPHLLPIMEQLMALEPIFHHPELGTTRDVYEGMTDPGFWEVNGSGYRYSRESVIQGLLRRYSRSYEERWETSDFYCQEIAPDNYLLTYNLIQDGVRLTRRSTIWRNVGGVWKIVYHQGTVVQEKEYGV